MKLLLCSDGDAAAMWAYNALRRLGCAGLELVTARELANATQWSHRVHSDGSSVGIHLQDGRTIDTSNVDGVINRLNWPSGDQLNQATSDDREYAWSEAAAFYLSWMNSFQGKVYNRATPQGLCGSWRSAVQWNVLAGQAGFHVAPCTDAEIAWTSSAAEGKALSEIVIFEGKPFGPKPAASVAAECRELYKASGTSLLGVTLYLANDGRWTFHSATPLPDLCAGGVPLLQEVMKAWTGEVMQ